MEELKMNWRMRKIIVLLVALVLSFQIACNKAENTSSNTKSDQSATETGETLTETSATVAPTEPASATIAPVEEKMTTIKPFDDIRAYENEKILKKTEYRTEDIVTFTFNEGTILEGNEELQAEIMENGTNPGLGIRELHKEGITGKGINVAIIDQNLLLHHPEFDGKIAGYYDTGCMQGTTNGSMHAPAVTSILVGNTIGVAPEAKVYFAAAPSWLGDSEYYANGLYWIIEENKKLPEGEKIRVVSVSAAPSGDGSPFSKNLELWDEAVLAAQKEGILVLDCRYTEETGIIAPAYYDPENPEDVLMCKGGFPTSFYVVPSSHIGVPTSYRTVAEEYVEGSPSYQYTGQGGLSWGIPYAAGVLAMGWQVNPDLDNDKIVQILFDTCTKATDGSNIINPLEFIEAVKNTKN
jgi:hypothetical protein